MMVDFFFFFYVGFDHRDHVDHPGVSALQVRLKVLTSL